MRYPERERERERAGWGKEEKITNNLVCIFSGSLYSAVYISKVFNLCQSESSKGS